MLTAPWDKGRKQTRKERETTGPWRRPERRASWPGRRHLPASLPSLPPLQPPTCTCWAPLAKWPGNLEVGSLATEGTESRPSSTGEAEVEGRLRPRGGPARAWEGGMSPRQHVQRRGTVGAVLWGQGCFSGKEMAHRLEGQAEQRWELGVREGACARGGCRDRAGV